MPRPIEPLGAHIESNGFGKFIPEPKNRLLPTFQRVLNGIGAVAGTALGATTGLDPSYQDLLNRQIEVQMQLQLVSLESNVEKSKHETQMAAIRNIRAG